MEWKSSVLLWATVAALISQNLVIPVISAGTVEDQKHYRSPDPNARTPPSRGGSYSPPKSSGGGGGGGPGHGHGGNLTINCGNPPSGGHHTPRPSTPSGGGGYHYSPPTVTPTTPTTPTTPSVPAPFFTPTPTTPTTPTVPAPFFTPPTPSAPIDPGTPSVTSPPLVPVYPPFTCDYWRNHPTLIWGILGWFGTVGGILGATSVPGFGSNMNLLEALSNRRTDGYGALYREGTASVLNSMVNKGGFPYTTKQVRDRFVSSLSSKNAAANQAQRFKLANEGRLKLGA